MIALLTGEVVYRGNGFVVVKTGSIGYKVIISDVVASTLHGEVTFFTHEVIRDNDHELYGFLSMDAMQLFWKLITVSGVGPKGAQKIVFADKIENVRSKIALGDIAF